MKQEGQIIVIVAFLIMVGLFLLALLVDGGRLYLLRGRSQRSAQAAADAGMGLVAEKMVTLAVPRQTQAASLSACIPDGDFGDTGATCTATPEPGEISHWLTNEDRLALIEPAMQSTVESLALDYAKRNDFSSSDPSVLELQAEYPYQYQPEAEDVRLRVLIRQRAVVLLAGLLGPDFVDLPAEAVSELPQR